MEQRISLITLGVRDMVGAATFYQALGWKRVETGNEGIVVFDLLGQALGLYPLEALADDIGCALGAPGFSGMTLGQNLRSRAEVDALIETARGAGAEILKEPQEVFWGGYHAYFADPEGHVWEIAHNPFSLLRDADGAFRWGGYGQEA